MTNEMSESERAAMRRLFDRFPSRAPVDASDVLAEIRRAVVEERGTIEQAIRNYLDGMRGEASEGSAEWQAAFDAVRHLLEMVSGRGQP